MTNHTKAADSTNHATATNDTDVTNSGDQAAQVGQTVQVDPAGLLMERNIRDAQADADLVKSLKAVGMLDPINAVLTTEGALLVRHGHRRTLAAIEAQVPALVYISGTDSTETDDEVMRIIAQRDENTHRAGLTTAENIGVIEQLTAFGLSANQIAKRSRINRTHVDQALSVAGSDLAKQATSRYEALTLDQAATVAEFEDDTETAKALIVAANNGDARFEHIAQRARDDRARSHRKDAALAPVREAGVAVIEQPSWSERDTLPLARLRLDPHDEPGTRTEDPAEHAQCPGHVAWAEPTYVLVDEDGEEVDEDDPGPEGDDDDPAVIAHHERIENATPRERFAVVYGCQGYATRGHVGLWQHTATQGEHTSADLSPDETDTAQAAEARQAAEDAEAEAKRLARRLVIENNKAWDSAQAVRHEHLAQLASRKTAPKGTAAFLVAALVLDSHVLDSADANRLAASWLNTKTTKSTDDTDDTVGGFGFGYGRDRAAVDAAETGTEARATMLALVQVLAAYETAMERGTWRRDNTTSGAGRYLRFLAETTGYGLSEVEEYAISDQTA